MKAAVVLRHVCFEDLGSFSAPLNAAGYAINYHDVGARAWDPAEIMLLS